ncbi:hypothetical protein [Comamonas testosteroni]|uniref:hypothetical protein n=1 Tax=Comamonas testosteroni TaxID=285 RepID=UPI002DBFFF88|nr:hypothetical protein [Comamonas testosteroni]MEB5966833.1 hypothetical protein [Comamonas testosteroni]
MEECSLRVRLVVALADVKSTMSVPVTLILAISMSAVEQSRDRKTKKQFPANYGFTGCFFGYGRSLKPLRKRLMPKPNYQFEKRQRELEKKKKKAEKAQRKAAESETVAPVLSSGALVENK